MDGSWLPPVTMEPRVIWDTATGELRFLLAGQGPAYSVAFSPMGSCWAWAARTKSRGGCKGASDSWRSRQAGWGHFPCGLYGGRCAAFSTDGKMLMSGKLAGAMVWDVSTGEVRADLKAGSLLVCGVAMAPDGKSLALGDYQGTVVLLDLATKTVRAKHQRGHQGKVTCVAFSPDGKTLATSSSGNDIKLWETATGREIASFKEGLESGWADRSCYMAFGPGGRSILSVSEMKVRMRDLTTGKVTATRDLSIGGRKYFIEKIVLSPDCATLAGIGQPTAEERSPEEGVVFLWDIATLTEAGAGH